MVVKITVFGDKGTNIAFVSEPSFLAAFNGLITALKNEQEKRQLKADEVEDALDALLATYNPY